MGKVLVTSLVVSLAMASPVPQIFADWCRIKSKGQSVRTDGSRGGGRGQRRVAEDRRRLAGREEAASMLGEKALHVYLVNHIQEVYQLQGVNTLLSKPVDTAWERGKTPKDADQPHHKAENYFIDMNEQLMRGSAAYLRALPV